MMQKVSTMINTPSVLVEPPPPLQPTSDLGATIKTKRKARSTRRRLNAMMNNTSLHFSDTDSEGELSVPRSNATKDISASGGNWNFLHPVISVTLDTSDDLYGNVSERRNSFLDNLTDVDEIYTSDPEGDTIRKSSIQSISSSPRVSLSVKDSLHQGETDLEDISNDDDEVLQAPIFVKPRTDIFTDYNGETITTKEGDGHFSIEVRNQMSFSEESKDLGNENPDIVVMPMTDSEDMEASEEEEEGTACGHRTEEFEDFDILAASQIVMRNVDKMEQQLMNAKEASGGGDDAISDSHTDVEDIE